MTQNDKKVLRMMSSESGHAPTDMLSLAPPESLSDNFSPSPSRLGRSADGITSDSEDQSGAGLGDKISAKTLFYLVSTLNASFPDYDFTSCKSQEFFREPSLQWVKEQIDAHLLALEGGYFNIFQSQMWAKIDDAIQLKDCHVYSYCPDAASNPFYEDGCIWSFNYFFYNRKLKRVLFFTCRCTREETEYEDDDRMSQVSEDELCIGHAEANLSAAY